MINDSNKILVNGLLHHENLSVARTIWISETTKLKASFEKF